jgi:tetratricopeptide (TPR) repeat protein
LVALFRWPSIGFLGVAFFAILSPTSSFVPIKELAFEYRMYLPLAPVIILVVFAVHHGFDWLLARWFRREPRGKGRALQWEARRASLRRWAPATLLAAVLALLALLTIQRNEDYRSERSIWEDTVRKSPHNARAHINLGNVYLGQAQQYLRSGDVERSTRAHEAALRSYSRAIDVDPQDATAYSNRGRVHGDLQQYDEALRDFDKAIEVDPDYAKAYHNRGNVYLELKRYDQAVADHTKAIQLDPETADSYYSRGNSYLQKGQLEQAIQDYTSAIQLRSVFPDAYVNRGSARLKQRRMNEAIADLTTAIQQQPTLGVAYSNRALAYCMTRQYPLAREDVRRLQQLGQRVDPRLLKLTEGADGFR